MSREPPRRDWRTPPTRNADLTPLEALRGGPPLAAIAAGCFLAAIVLLAILCPELR
ncbi:MAG: hypothetical protein ACXW27_08675 [Allosphingosinicella sp.]